MANWGNVSAVAAICLCLIFSSAVNAHSISESQAQKLYNQGLTLYKLGNQPGLNLKEALRHNFQGLVNALKVVNRYIVAHPHQEIRSLLIRLFKLAETKSLETEAHKLTDKDRYNIGYKQGVYDAGQYIANDTGSCSLQHHTVSYCDGYKADFDARQSDDG